jgi:CBS domain-containing protein
METTVENSQIQKINDPLFQIGTSASELITVNSDANILDAIQLMKDNGIGDVIVTEDLDGEKMPVGVLTDRDIALDVLTQTMHPERLKVSAVMTKTLVTCSQRTGVFQMIQIMKREGVSKLPLVDDNGVLKGLINAKHLIQMLIESLYDLSHIAISEDIPGARLRH